jgi:cell division protease FtsH
MKRSEKILKDNMGLLHRLSNALLEREILDADEIDKIMHGEELPPAEKRVNGVKEEATPKK